MIYFPQPPSDTPPSGGDQNEAPLLRAIIGTELGVCTLVIAARLYTRLRLVRNAGIDDWIMFATYVDFQQRIDPVNGRILIFQSGTCGHRILAGSHRHGVRHWATCILSWSRDERHSYEARLGFAGLRDSGLDNRQDLGRLLHLATFEHEMAQLVLADSQCHPHHYQHSPDHPDIRSVQACGFAMGSHIAWRMLGPDPSRHVGHLPRM